MDLLLQEKNEILISRIFKTQDLSQKAEICEKRTRSRFCRSRLQSKIQESIRSKFRRNLKSQLSHQKQKLRNKNKIFFLRSKGLKFKNPERIRSKLNGRQLQTKSLISFLFDTNEIYFPKNRKISVFLQKAETSEKKSDACFLEEKCNPKIPESSRSNVCLRKFAKKQ